jgi:dTDP-4-dehydrorhamnose reductase
MTRVVILGGGGRLGAALARRWADRHAVIALARPELDVADLPALAKLLAGREFDVLVNATGLTNVDRCETARDEATLVNTEAPRLMGRLAAERSARFLHFSTDYVFDGEKPTPYTEADAAHPLSHYGATKLAGEVAALEASDRHLAVRVSWVFGPEKPSFVDALVDRALQHDHVEAIADKTSCPTFADDVADWLEPFLTDPLPGGLYHACNAGGCTWREYGQFAVDCAVRAGAPVRARQVAPLALADMKAFVARRPRRTVLDTTRLGDVTGRKRRSWQDAVADYIAAKFSPR